MRVTYTKLNDGGWGLRISVDAGESVTVGDAVTVVKRDGSSKTETVGRILWSGEDRDNPGGRVALCATRRLQTVAA